MVLVLHCIIRSSENLRKQTANRLYNDLKYSKVKTLIQWNRIDNLLQDLMMLNLV